MDSTTCGNAQSQRRLKRRLMGLSHKDSYATSGNCSRPHAPFNSTSFLIELHDRQEEAAFTTSLNFDQYGSMVKIMASSMAFSAACCPSSAENHRYQHCSNHSRARQHSTLANSRKHSNLLIHPHTSRNSDDLRKHSSVSDALPSTTTRL